jgi:hypothetical protein
MDIKTTKQPNGDWVAIDADNYEAECDSQGWWSNSPAGYGATEAEAIRELLEDIEERAHKAERKHYA